MNILPLIMKVVAGIRDFVSPRYRPDLYYMRGPGPATARRAVLVQSRQVLPRLPREQR
jgi:hypothetical protein